MAVLLSVQDDFRKLSASLDDFGRKQLPKAAAEALNGAAFIGRSIIRKEMESSFDRPNRWTLGGIRVERATPKRLESAVGLKDRLDMKSRGLPLSAYLKPQIEGGTRGQKSHEKALARAGVLPPGYYLVPTKYADLDAHGNMRTGQIIKILSSLRAFSDVGFTANAAWGRKSRGRRKHEDYFAIVPGRPQGTSKEPGSGGGLPPAIYKVVASGLGRIVLPVAAIVQSSPSYTARFDFWGTAQRLAERYVPKLLAEAMDKAMRQAAPR